MRRVKWWYIVAAVVAGYVLGYVYGPAVLS